MFLSLKLKNLFLILVCHSVETGVARGYVYAAWLVMPLWLSNYIGIC